MSNRSRNQLNNPVPQKPERHGLESQQSYDRGNRHYSDSYHYESQDEDRYHHQPATHDDTWLRRNSDNNSGYYNDEPQELHSRYSQTEYQPSEGQVYEHRTDRQFGYSEAPQPEQDYYEHSTTQGQTQERDVWLKEKQGRITFNDADLEHINFTKHGNGVATLAGYAGVAAMLGLVGFLALSSQPELSPVDIIQMEGYAGEQPIKTPFNLASLHDCEVGTECAELGQTNIIPVTSASSTQSITRATTQTTTIDTASSFTGGANSSSAEILENTIATGSAGIQEIPAAVITSSSNFDALSGNTSITDSMVVLQQWSNVRNTPGIDGAILTSLATGQTVTRISQNGPWIEVRVDEQPSTTGYMHRSTVAQQ